LPFPTIPENFRKILQELSELSWSRTDRQTSKLWQKHNLLGRGNYCTTWCWWHGPAVPRQINHINKIALQWAGLLLGWLRAGKPSPYKASQLGQLSLLPSVGW